jgi:hypothetical protein
MIRAEVHSDDDKVTATFDATPFFEQATLAELLGLADIGWGGNSEADAVALFMHVKDKNVRRVFEYLSFHPSFQYSGDRVGFECKVNERDAAAWVRANKPEWFDTVWPDGFDGEEDS